MTPEILTTLLILLAAIILFVTERIRVDAVALLVLVSLAITGLVSPTEALSGFSNVAVVTVWAVLILSGGLSRTGVANIIGRQVLRFAGESDIRIIATIMLSVGVLSGFMNDIGVAALMLPVVMDLARRTGRPPSKLLMPLAFAALLGGLNTLIGTPPNILISEALRDAGLRPFQMFDYTPVGVVVMLAGVAFMALVGRHLLPARDIGRVPDQQTDAALRQLYDFSERLFRVRIAKDSSLVGKSLVESRLGSALRLNVISITQDRETVLAPEPSYRLRAGDALLVSGKLDQLDELRGRRHLVLKDEAVSAEELLSPEVGIAEVRVAATASLIGQTLLESGFRRRYGALVLSVVREGVTRYANVDTLPLRSEDTLLIHGPEAQFEALRQSSDFDLIQPAGSAKLAEAYELEERLVKFEVSPDSILVGKSLAESRVGETFGLAVLGILRQGEFRLAPSPYETLKAGDTLLVKGDPNDLLALRGLQKLEFEPVEQPDLESLESEKIGLAEAVLSPHTTLAGKTLRQLHFRQKYGLSVLAVWREGRAHRSNLGNLPLRLGDAMLVYGSRDNLQVLGSEPDFLVLTEAAQEPLRLTRAPVAALIMVAVLTPVILGWLPIAISAVAGVLLMILTGCLTMEEAYRYIEWKAVFLIAGMLPLGIAMERTGTARFLAEGAVGLVGDFGPLAVLAGLFVLAALASQVMPNPAVAVLLAPIALNTASDVGVSPFPFMMAIAVSASAAFLSPVGHSANVLVMGPGGYRFSDYLKVGAPLTLVVMIVVLFVLPIIWPFYP